MEELVGRVKEPGRYPLSKDPAPKGRSLFGLVTTSSAFQDDGALVHTALEAFQGEPVHVIATMHAGIPDGLQVPANATAARFIPHNAVLGRAADAVTHGAQAAADAIEARLLRSSTHRHGF